MVAREKRAPPRGPVGGPLHSAPGAHPQQDAAARVLVGHPLENLLDPDTFALVEGHGDVDADLAADASDASGDALDCVSLFFLRCLRVERVDVRLLEAEGRLVFRKEGAEPCMSIRVAHDGG